VGNHSKDKIVMLIRQKEKVILHIRPPRKAVAGNPAGGDGLFGLQKLVAAAFFPVVEPLRPAHKNPRQRRVMAGHRPDFLVLQHQTRNPHPLIVAHRHPQKGACKHRQSDNQQKMPALGPGRKKHRKQDRHHQDYRPQVRLQQD